MNKTLLLAGVALVFAIGANAAIYKPYASIKGAWVEITTQQKIKAPGGTLIYKKNLTDDFEGLRLAVGAKEDFKYGSLRYELELGHNFFRTEKGVDRGIAINGKIQTYTGFFNIYYDMTNRTKFTPYIGAGIGYAYLKTKTVMLNNTRDKDKANANNIAWNIGAGVAYDINQNFIFDLGYRYTDYGTTSGHLNVGGVVNKTKGEVHSHEVGLGLRYTW